MNGNERIVKNAYRGITMSYHYTEAATLLALLLYLGVAYNVAMARGRYKIKAPAVTGDENFERAYRVQMNTIEQMVFFLPAMWLYAILLNDIGAAVGGLIWVVGRLIYAFSYLRNPTSRSTGFTIGFVAALGLYLGAVYGLLKAF
jgi:glutathione S-transferase